MENVISREQAAVEFDRWAFEIKRIKERLINDNPDALENREAVIKNIMDGTFTIDEEGKITHKLCVPISDDVKELVYKPRMQVFEMSKMKEFKPEDSTGKTIAIMSVLTNLNKGIVQKLDTVDFTTVGELMSFYLLGG